MVSQHIKRLFLIRSRAQCEVDKAGAVDHSLFAKLGNIEMRNDFFREPARLFGTFLSKHERDVCLVITKSMVRRLC